MFNLFSSKKKRDEQESSYNNDNSNNNNNNNNSMNYNTNNTNNQSNNNTPIQELPSLNEIQILTQHTKPIKTLLKIDSERLASASDDNDILIWSISSGRLLMKLEGHTQRVTCLLSFSNLLISGSMDKKIKMWDLNKLPTFNEETKSNQLECIRTLEKHEKSLKFLEKIPNGFCSVSFDDDLIIWSEEGEFVRNIVRIQKDNTNGILCVHNYIIVAGSISPFLIAYQYDSTNKPAIALGQELTHKDWVCSLFNISNDRFVTGSKDQSIIVWDSKSLKPIYQQQCKQPINYLFPILPGDYILATMRKGFSIFDTRGGTTVLEYQPNKHEEALTTELNGAITLYNNSKILTWADTRVSVWGWQFESVGNKKTKLPLRPTFIGDMKGHTDYISCVAILSDNSIATGSLDSNIILWKDGKYQSETRTCVANFLLNDFHARNNSQYIEHYADDEKIIIQESLYVEESTFD